MVDCFGGSAKSRIKRVSGPRGLEDALQNVDLSVCDYLCILNLRFLCVPVFCLF